MQYILKTDRLQLRELTFDDASDLAEVLSDPESMRYYPEPLNAAKVHQWIEWCQQSYERDGFGLWAVILKETGECIGDCGISMQEVDEGKVHEVGYHIKPQHSKRGYASEAARACMEYAFEKLKVEKVYSYMHHQNTPSRRVAEKNGMQFLREFTKNDMCCAIYGMERREWRINSIR
ncbi:MAG: GNAT family N-acetyltransferase [Opitutales bacterium]|nr:GNAT family N-acetyltransferase [Opitutales bacterium]